MLRFFGLLQKINFPKVTAYELYQAYTRKFNPFKFPCPVCRNKYPDWKRHDTYERYIITFEKGQRIHYLVIIIRYKCDSCGHTHALLPEFLIPYRSYSLLFILAVLKDYFAKSLTIEKISEKYGIAASTIYTWKALFLKNKKIWLGLLEDSCITAADFIKAFFNKYIYVLEEFHLESNLSFLQTSRKRINAHSPP
jgi:transposase-like protein